MAKPTEEPLDERMHAHHDMALFYQGQFPGAEFHMRYMDENMIHRYVSESPFFDWTSKNGLEIEQSRTDIVPWNISHNRKQFEDVIARRPGLEFMIAEGETMEFDAEGKPSKGVWVVRKQEREKMGGKDGLTTLGTYWINGEQMFQAPSVGDVIGNRLLAATNALNNFWEKASSLPHWSPANGHTYLPPSSKAPASSGPLAGSPSHSREGSVAGLDSSIRSNSALPPGASSTTTAASDTVKANALLTDSLRLAFTYADDPYADENPLTGEPGNFTFKSSNAAARKRKQDEEAALAAAAKAKEEKAAAASTSAAVKAPSPPAIFTEAKVMKEKKGGKSGDKKRRKSRPNGGQSTPASPATPVSAGAKQA